MSVMASQITSLIIVYPTVYSGADQRKHQSSASLAFKWGIHRWPVNSPQKGPVNRKMFPFDDIIIKYDLGGHGQSPQNNRDLHQGILHLWSKFGGSGLNRHWVMVRTSSKWGKFWFSSWIWPWRSRSIAPQNNRDLNQGLLYLWSQFGDPHSNRSQVIMRTSQWLTHAQTDTHM